MGAASAAEALHAKAIRLAAAVIFLCMCLPLIKIWLFGQSLGRLDDGWMTFV
jgi:hypothetical protein